MGLPPSVRPKPAVLAQPCLFSVFAVGGAGLRRSASAGLWGHGLLGICIWLLVFCRDLLASVTPFLLVFLLSTQRYESLGDFLPCAVLAAPFFAALIWHLMVWPVTFRVGRSATGLLLVSAATLLGAAGSCPCISCFSR